MVTKSIAPDDILQNQSAQVKKIVNDLLQKLFQKILLPFVAGHEIEFTRTKNILRITWA